MNSTAVIRLFLLLCSSQIGWAHAQNVIRNEINIGVGVLATCQVNSVSDIDFGKLDPSMAIDSFAQGEITFACTRGMNYRITLSNGEHFDSNTQMRYMVSQGTNPSYLPYELAISRQSGIGTGFQNPSELILNAQVRGIHYRDLSAGGYADTIQITFEP